METLYAKDCLVDKFSYLLYPKIKNRTGFLVPSSPRGRARFRAALIYHDCLIGFVAVPVLIMLDCAALLFSDIGFFVACGVEAEEAEEAAEAAAEEEELLLGCIRAEEEPTYELLFAGRAPLPPLHEFAAYEGSSSARMRVAPRKPPVHAAAPLR